MDTTSRMIIIHLAYLLGLLALFTPPSVAARNSEGTPSARSNATATISGKVFYNDQRSHGLFAERRDNKGDPGAKRTSTADKPDCGFISRGLATLRAEQGDLIEKLELITYPRSRKVLETQLANVEAQIEVEERYLKECQGTYGPNWLAGKYMVVDVIEHDKGILLKDEDGLQNTACLNEQILTSATVAYDGSFSATFPTNDPCENDLLDHSAIELRVRLQFCNTSYCFSINTPENQPYALSHPRASASNLMTVRAGNNITMATLNFNNASDPALPNNHSIAANYYASIVDTILTLHKDNPIPFYREEFGELQFIFPSNESGSATAQSPTRVVISSFESQPFSLGGHFRWVDGWTPAHEYGHILMQRAWGGDYGFEGMGITAYDYKKAQEPSEQLAFKEAWAHFIAHAVFEPTAGCSLDGFDANGEIVIDYSNLEDNLAKLRDERKELLDAIEMTQHPPTLEHLNAQLADLEAQIASEEQRLAEYQKDSTRVDYTNSQTYMGDWRESYTDQNLKGPLGEGAQWRDNVVKALCDWYDTRVDDDRNLAGSGDTFSETGLYGMWYNLRRMYIDADKYGGEYKNPGLWFCDYVDYYLNVRKSASAVGQPAHARYEDDIRNLIYNNNIGCFMAPPQ